MTGHRTEVGSRLESIEVYKKILSGLDLLHTNRLSDIEEVDLAQAITLLQVKQTLYESALYSASQILSLNLVDFLR
jgi:flagellar hook-associated protein 3 FlgL